MSETHTHDRLADVNALVKRLRRHYPTEAEAFLNFMRKAEDGVALTAREKELVNVGLSVAAQCKWCIDFHTRNAINAGANRDEIVEAGFMAIVMHGGPAFMYLTTLLEALDDLAPEGER